jgi:hypothetical protein
MHGWLESSTKTARLKPAGVCAPLFRFLHLEAVFKTGKHASTAKPVAVHPLKGNVIPREGKL